MDRRVKFIFGLFCIWLAVIACRLWYMQVARQVKYTEMSSRNRTRFVRIPSARGKIYDRYGRLLADNKAATQLVVTVDEVADKQELSEELAGLTNLSPAYILKKIKENIFKPFLPAVLADDMTTETLINVSESKWRLPGVNIQTVPVRDYLAGEYFSHLVGYVGEVGEREINSGFICGDIVGRSGIENSFDKKLRGEDGHKEIQVDYKGSVDSVVNVIEPKNGDRVFLTIDSMLQEELYNAMNGRKGAGVAMCPETGEILALVSVPGFNPNELVSPVKEEVVKKLFADKKRPMLNRAISGLYPPGSVFKIIVSAAALEKGVITKKSLFFCDGEFRLGDTKFRCWEKKGHEWMDLANGLKKSCNEYFYQAGLKTGREAIIDMSEKFGLGRATDIELQGEKKGSLPGKDSINGRWSSGDTVNLSIGHGKILVTPIQIACCISAVANGGVLYKPRITLDEMPEWKKIDVKEEYLQLVKESLRRVVNEPDGTGYSAYVEELNIFGKTGTVELKESKMKGNICWFAGAAALGEKSIAVVVVVEEGESGGATCGPIAQKVFKKWKEVQYGEII